MSSSAFNAFLLSFCVIQIKARHWIPASHQVVHGVHIGHPVEFINRPFGQKLRFKVTYDASVNILSFAKQNLIKQKLIVRAVNYFHRTLSVKSIDEPIKLQRMCKDNAYFLKHQNDGREFQYCKGACKETTCGPIKVPEAFLDDCRVCDNKGFNCIVKENDKLIPKNARKADFILFVSSIQTQHCKESNIVAYASYCQQEHALNRPVAGFANLCPEKLETDSQSFENLLATVKHEIYHALGFSVGLFAFYRDNKGRPLTPRDKHGLPKYNNVTKLYQWSNRVIKKVMRNPWSVSGGFIKHQVQMLVTDNVLREVRRHFNCSTLEGAELENQGGEGTALTHWEKRVFENEAMTGTYTQHPVFSRMTLALMEDTGWYKANYDMAEDLDWGKGLGCLFVKSNCRTWIANRLAGKLPTAPFCATLKQSPLHMRCTHTKLSLALCNLVKYTGNLPREFQYFDRLGKTPVKDISTYGGAVELADFCPFYQKFTLTDESGKKRGTTCTLLENSPPQNKNYALEQYGAMSKCVEHGQHWTAKKGLLTRTMLDWGSGCYRYKCTPKGLVFIIGGKRYSCMEEGSRVVVIGLMNNWKVNGSLICPSCEDFCGKKSYCTSIVEKLKSSLLELEESSKLPQGSRGSELKWESSWLMVTIFLAIYLS